MASNNVDVDALKSTLKDLGRRTGRGADTIIAHITPEEAHYLENKYGLSSENPVTGLREFGGEPGAGAAGAGEGEGGGGVGGGGGGSGGGGEGARGGGPADAPGNVGSGVGGPQGRGGADPRGGGDPQSAGAGSFGTGVGSGIGGAPGAVEAEAVGASATGPGSAGLSESGFNRALSRAMNLAFGPLSLGVQALGITSEEDEAAGITGMMGATRGIARGIGTAANQGLSALGLDVGHAPTDEDSPDPQGPTGVGVAAPGGVPAGGGGVLEPPVPSDFSLQRPDALEAPAFLGLGNAMTPLQQRAKLATFGTGSEVGGYRSEPALDFYKNLFLRSVIGDDGQIAEGAQLLPVEAQYIQQNLGLDPGPDVDIENFARSLSDLPSREQAAAFLSAFEAANAPREREQI